MHINEKILCDYLPVAVDIVRHKIVFHQQYGYISYCDDIQKFPTEEKESLEQFNIKSYLYSVIHVNGIIFGAIGIDNCFEKHTWTEEDFRQVSTLADCLACILLRMKTTPILTQTIQRLEVITR